MKTFNDRSLPDSLTEAAPSVADLLVSSGRLAREDLARIRLKQQDANVAFDTAAVELGIMSRDEVEALLRPPPTAFDGAASSPLSPELVCATAPDNPFATAVYRIRTALALAHRGRRDALVVAIVGTERGEGRTTLAANLAVAFAQMQVRTVLVDADMRHGRLHSMFGLEPTSSLAGALGVHASADVEPPTSASAQDTLSVMSAGSSPNPQALLSTVRFKAVLSNLARRNDVLIFDTPCWTDGADAQLIAAETGLALVCTRFETASKARVQSMVRALARDGVKVLGVPTQR